MSLNRESETEPAGIVHDGGYDRLASVYAILERSLFGGRLWAARCSLLGELPEFERALVFGDGDGRLLTKLVESFPQARFVSLDASAAMLRRQRGRLAHTDQVSWIHADARQHDFDRASFDLLILPFVLDCFSMTELRDHVPHWTASVNEGGSLYVIDFAPPTRSIALGKLRLWLMHRFFGAVTRLPNRDLVNFRGVLVEAGWRVSRCWECSGGLIRTEIYQREGSGD